MIQSHAVGYYPQQATQRVELPSGSQLYVADKPWIVDARGITTQLTLDLRYRYVSSSKNSTSGWSPSNKGPSLVHRERRTDAQVTTLALQWADRLENHD